MKCREFVYVGEPAPQITEQEHAAFYLQFQKSILTQLADIDCNGEINIADATCLRKHLAEFYMDTPLDITADINKDGVISIGDVTEYQRWLAEIY